MAAMMPRGVIGQKDSVAYMDYNSAKRGETHDCMPTKWS